MDPAFDQVVASYHRARQSGQLFDTFYSLFLGKSPEIPLMFARTDFPHQKLMLRESILEMLIFTQTGSGRDEIKRLAERHRQLNVRAAHYHLWLDALCEALANLVDHRKLMCRRLPISIRIRSQWSWWPELYPLRHSSAECPAASISQVHCRDSEEVRDRPERNIKEFVGKIFTDRKPSK